MSSSDNGVYMWVGLPLRAVSHAPPVWNPAILYYNKLVLMSWELDRGSTAGTNSQYLYHG